MKFYVYIIISKRMNRYISYVGYSKNIEKRLILHNTSKGAKFTKGNKWYLIYKKSYNSKITAMKEEFKLKKNYKLRSLIKKKYLNNENINSTSL
ncbi:MAG: GIY-YIG nuclease family protein [Flavobacteriales bacterium TMED235]|nr:MAG: GIY-YIG nuclease family protein [Flavobacteriales bacterium TMED235]